MAFFSPKLWRERGTAGLSALPLRKPSVVSDTYQKTTPSNYYLYISSRQQECLLVFLLLIHFPDEDEMRGKSFQRSSSTHTRQIEDWLWNGWLPPDCLP